MITFNLLGSNTIFCLFCVCCITVTLLVIFCKHVWFHDKISGFDTCARSSFLYAYFFKWFFCNITLSGIIEHVVMCINETILVWLWDRNVLSYFIIRKYRMQWLQISECPIAKNVWKDCSMKVSRFLKPLNCPKQQNKKPRSLHLKFIF